MTNKASRIFAGYEHERQAKRIADHFQLSPLAFRNIKFNPEIAASLEKKQPQDLKNCNPADILQDSLFEKRELADFSTAEEAYHQLILDIVRQQYVSTQLVVKGTAVNRIIVDGGFSKNAVYMNLLAAYFPEMEVFAASMAQATAMGTALSIRPGIRARCPQILSN